MYKKIIITSLYFKLLIISALLELTISLSNQRLVPNRRDLAAFRKKYIQEKLKSNRNEIPAWFKHLSNRNQIPSFQEDQTYTNPCQNQVEVVKTINLDKGSKGVFYIPSTLREVSCIGNSINSATGNPICQGFEGDCINIVSSIDVEKYMEGLYVPVIATIEYNVGCACMIVH